MRIRLPKTAFFSSSLLLALDASVAAVLTAAFWLLSARLLAIEAVGTANAILAAASLIALLSRFGFDFAIPYFFPRAASPARLTEAALTVTGGGALAGGIAFVASLRFWLPGLSFLMRPGWAALFLLFTLSLAWINMFLALGLAQRKVGWVVVQDVIQNGGRILLWLAFLKAGGFGQVEGVLVAYAVSAAASVVLGFLVLLPGGTRPRRPDRRTFAEVWPYAIGSHGTTLLASAPNFLVPLLVTAVMGPAYTAVFSVVWMVRSAVVILHSSTVSVTFAEGSREPERLRDRFPLLLYLVWGMAAAVTIGFWLVGNWGLRLFGGDYDRLGFPLLMLTGFGLPFLMLNDFTVIIQRIYGRLRPVYAVMGGINAIWLGLCVPAMLRFGLVGLGGSYLIAQGTVALGGLFLLRPHPLKRDSLQEGAVLAKGAGPDLA